MCANVYISANFLAEHGGCIQALDAVTYQASHPGYGFISQGIFLLRNFRPKVLI
jgi:acetyl/propionyl-CoA carboxylase alpha subunit